MIDLIIKKIGCTNGNVVPDDVVCNKFITFHTGGTGREPHGSKNH